MRRLSLIAPTLVACWFVLLLAAPAVADPPGLSGHRVHLGITGIVIDIRSGMVFVQVPNGLQYRTVSPNKADRVGLHEAKAGDRLLLWVDEGNVLVDVHKAGSPMGGHRIVAGTLDYADSYWGEIKLSTPEGIERFEVDTLMGSKLQLLHEGMSVMVELDEDNVAIDIRRSR